MRIQALKTLLDGRDYTRKGQIVELDDFKARELIALGYAVEIPEPKRSVAAPLAVSRENPTIALQAGSRDGLAKPASLSQEDQAPSKRTYKKRAVKPA